MTDFEAIHGRCQCGAVRYTVTAPATALYHCHCSMCRLAHGTVFATYATVPREHLVVDRGADNLATFDSSAEVHRHFCRTCGSHLLIDVDGYPEQRWYTPGTVGGDPGHPPGSEHHIYVGSKVGWYEIDAKRPQYETQDYG